MAKLLAYLLVWLLGLVAAIVFSFAIVSFYFLVIGKAQDVTTNTVAIFVSVGVGLIPALMARGLYLRFLKP